MPTKSVSVTRTGYVELDTTPGSALDVQNVSTQTVRLVYADAQPAIDEKAYYLIGPREGDVRGSKTGSMWAIADGPHISHVTVGE